MIPVELRPLIGNRIYGCDDCLAVCPGTNSPGPQRNPTFCPREELTAPRLAALAELDDAAFRTMFAGTAIKRTGRDRFVRNVLIAIGNAPPGDAQLLAAAQRRLDDRSPLVRAAAAWAFLGWRRRHYGRPSGPAASPAKTIPSSGRSGNGRDRGLPREFDDRAGDQLGFTQGAAAPGSTREGAAFPSPAAPFLVGLTLAPSISTLISSSEVSPDFPTLTRIMSLADLDIAADDIEQFALQCRQKIRRVAARPLMGEHDLQPLAGDHRAVPPLREKQIEEAHQALPNKVRKMLRRSGCRNRISRCSPRKRATASR